MRKIRLLVGILSLSLVGLISMAFGGSTAKAALWCYQVTDCTGQAGCITYGSVIGPCLLECVDYTRVQCNFVYYPEPPCYPIRDCIEYQTP